MTKLPCFFVVCFFLILTYSHPSYANTTYTVKKGDSLSKIANKFRVPVDRIKQANRLDSNDLRPGEKLEIPAAKSSPARKAASAGSTASGVQSADDKERKEAAPQEFRYHTVSKGDTLASLSRKYAVPVKELKELNNLRKASRLKVGQQLAVKRVGPKTYTVKKGDTLLKVAKKFNVTSDELMEFNDLETEDLKPGQKLLLEEQGARADAKTYSPILSQAGVAEDIKTLSESPELEALGMKERVQLFAKKMLDIPYRFGGSSFMGIDCSGYVQKVFGFMNVPLPRSAREQFHIGEPVEKEDLSIGDLVFFRTYASFPSHVGIYLGNNLFIHASSRGKKVTIDSLETPYYVKRFIGAKRLLSEELPDKKETEKEG